MNCADIVQAIRLLSGRLCIDGLFKLFALGKSIFARACFFGACMGQSGFSMSNRYGHVVLASSLHLLPGILHHVLVVLFSPY